MSLQDTVIEFSPWYLRGPVGGRLFESIATVGDELIEAQVRGLDQGNPLLCDASALEKIGEDRRIRRYPTESEESYRFRLSRWRQAWKMAGSHKAQLEQLQLYFSPAKPMIRQVHQSGDGQFATWHTIDSRGYSRTRVSPSNWDWDSQYYDLVNPGSDDSTLRWSRYWTIIYVDELFGLTTPIDWGSSNNYGGGAIYGGFFTAAQYADMISVISDWKAAHSQLWGLIIATDPDSFDPSGSGAGYPDGTWGLVIDPYSGEPTRLNTALYPYDLGQG